MWEEVIADKKTHEDKVIHKTLKIHLKWCILYHQIKLQVFPKCPNIQKLPQD
jgi:hypothetical protein